ncbi:hypothetical protein SAMN05444392_102210 [Seinonella peptonophila]|uniref:HD/PDEase domain-containing protein n=2 Tax=Seinonella peptonophila TaxID=112248 RepID=A0A1M4V790_9BACL|nr:hypothetical protein SAMN05444392_102210 [Seinonella peptonophila]
MKEIAEPPKKTFKQKGKPFDWRRSKRIRIGIYAILGIAFYLLLMKDVLPVQYDLREGSISKETIFSPITTIDKFATQKARNEAIEKVEPQYSKDEEVINTQIERVDRFFTEAQKVIVDKNLDEKAKTAKLQKLFPVVLSDEFYKNVLVIPLDQLQEIRLSTREIVFKILNEGVRRDEVSQKKKLVDISFEMPSLSSESQAVVRELTKQSIIPNEFYDPKATAALQKATADSMNPIPIRKGQVIVAKGDIITSDQYRKLKDLGYIHDQTIWSVRAGLALIIIFMIVMSYVYLDRFHHHLHQDLSKLIILASVLFLTVIGMKVVSIGQNLEWNTIGYLAPTAFGVMLIALLLDTHLAFGSAVLLSIIASVIYQNENYFLFDFRYGLVSLVSSVASAFYISKVRQRSKILVAGLIASGTSIPLILAMLLLVPTDIGDWKTMLISLSFGLASGIFSAVLTIGFLPYFETVFSILSPMRLIELSNPNHPLLRKLLVDAPGTYHHSIIVGNLSEAAAEAIGADGLLARVGAYYHDVGKTKRPQFFIENQFYQENPHDKIAPNLSKTIILNHPKDGVELLRKYHIPKPLQDIAAQHHGTTLLKYFYFKAVKQSAGTQMIEEDYRYPGPKAQFKEAAIVGICDCVEAAVRSIARPTPARIENMVRKIIQDRLEDGQFNECDLTLKELELIRKSICETLQGLFHSRIEYPELPHGKGVKHG